MNLEIIHQKAAGVAKDHALLFVHGMWHAAWCWEPHFLPYFSKIGYDTYALSLRNHGGSGSNKKIRAVRLREYAADVVSAVEQIDKPVVLVGHSMGGMIVQKYLEEHEAAAAILLASVPPHGIIGATLKVVWMKPLYFFKANLLVNLYPLISTPALARKLLFSASLPEDKVKLYQSKLQNEAYFAYWDMLLFDIPKTKKIKSPKMLVLGAGNDAVVSRKNVLRTAKAYDADVKIIPGVAHDMMLDTHWEAVAEEMGNWLVEKVG